MYEEYMSSTDIHPQEVGEADIQQYFSAWGQGSIPSWSHAGAPSWLEALCRVSSKPYCRTPFGYSFQPDILGESNGTPLVLELKCARKYEPLALAEVLHHAHLLSQQKSVPVIPVLVTQYNGWLRSALEFLRIKGLRDGSVRYVEFTALRFGSGTILWFDEPFSRWKPCSAPTLPVGLSVGSMHHWYKVDGADTWIATEQAFNERPALWMEPYLMLTEDHANSRVLTWEGGPMGTGRYVAW